MTAARARMCILSQRGTQHLVSRCVAYEFEDVLRAVDRADLIAPEPRRRGFTIGHKISNRVARHLGVPSPNFGLTRHPLRQTYDLFFAACMFPSDLASLQAVRGWRSKAAVAVCWLEEVWTGQLARWKVQLKQLAQFDHVILNCAGSVDAVQEAIGRPCHYVPPGVDALRFSPYPEPPARVVDVYSLGRRSPVRHDALRDMADRGEIFYLHDTVRRLETERFAEHRQLVANIAKRSRLFLVDTAKRGREFETHGQPEVGFRFFEGAAAGTVMVGHAPDTEPFRENFGWSDAVIDAPADRSTFPDVIRALLKDTQRLDQVGARNALHALRRHDWAHRWRSVLDIAGLEPLEPLAARIGRLDDLAASIAVDVGH